MLGRNNLVKLIDCYYREPLMKFRIMKEKGFSLVPLNFHFSHGYVKVTVGLVTGKKLYDKRQDMAERDAKRDIAKRLKEQQKY